MKLQVVRAAVLVLLIACSVLALACNRTTPILSVRVHTGLVPGPEFASVETTIQSSAASGSRGVIDMAEARARFGMDFVHGHSVATFALPEGEYRVRVRLTRPGGALLVERVIAIQLQGDTVLPVHLTRDCVGVTCPAPGGSAELSTCLAGQCVDPRCNEATREFCPAVTFCNDVSECSAAASCATVECDLGVCVAASIDEGCPEDEWCNPDRGAGCQPFTPTMEAAPSYCGTVCADPATPCSFGYWNCDDASPVCTPLQNRPSDFVCADGRSCDTLGECVVTDTPDEPGIVITPTNGLVTTEAGGNATFTVVLNAAPTDNVFLIFASSDTSEGTVAPGFVSFTPSNWNVPQTITATGINDSIDDGDVAYTITSAPSSSADARYDGIDATDVSVTNSDDDVPAGIMVTPTSGLNTSEAGGEAMFSVVLLSQPTNNVVIPLMSSDASEGTVLPASLTFTNTNWNVAQTVTVRGVNDASIDGSQTYSVNVGPAMSADPLYDMFGADSVSLTNSDDEMAGITVNTTMGHITTELGATANFTIVLDAQPSSNVMIALSSTDLSEGMVSPASLTFTTTNWNTPRTVTITGVNDDVDDDDVAYAIVTGAATSSDPNYNGMAVSDVSVSNSDDDTAGITITPTSGLVTVAAGHSASFSVVLHSEPLANVSIELTSSDAAQGTASPSTLTFTTMNWDTPQIVTLNGVDDMVDDGQIAVVYVIHTSDAMSSDAKYSGFVVSDVTALNINIVQRTYVKASNTGINERFGIAIAMSADANTLAVSATFEDSSATGVGGDESDDSTTDSGAVYVYTRSGMTWSQQAYIKASNPDVSDEFGRSLSLSDDGNTLVVGTEFERSSAIGIGGNESDNSVLRAGAAYVFVRMAGTWAQEAYVKASNTGANDYFGHRVALSADGDTLAVSAYGEASNATGINGNQANNSATGAGAVYVFTRSMGTWTQQAYIKPSNTNANDFFGDTVALSDDGNRLVVGSRQEDSNATGVGGDAANNSASNSGAAFVFERSMGTWTQQAYLKASNTDINDGFGWSVAISGDGDTIAVGAFREASNATGIDGDQLDNSVMFAGAAYVFARSAGVWTQQAYVKASNTGLADTFGDTLALSTDGNVLAIGSQYESSDATGVEGDQDNDDAPGSGAVYVFVRSTGVWAQRAYLKASNQSGSPYFGNAIAISGPGNTLAVAAYQEDSAATGINGDQNDLTGSNSGAAYLFYW